VIHTDFQRGFIKAECIHWDELLELGSWSGPRRSASSASRARTTRSPTGDVLEFRFNV
jgi:ribosome-binding ATPase YchF (GTP1/OBG family)